MENAGQACAECLAPVSVALNAQSGAMLCPQCAAQFYHPCARCGGLIPLDEAVVRDGASWCLACLAAPVTDAAVAALSDTDVAALVRQRRYRVGCAHRTARPDDHAPSCLQQ
jgi:recombinational DNA repair protein (RecF pathway)